ncbi:MAG: radical SAM family heme chaperone HemW [Acidobacteria bacterium]|nr:radical SAM family heme chaperone HemW [Acidobacteriota bacterium]
MLNEPVGRQPVSATRIGIYIHLPFCATRCNYCDFATTLFDENMARRYLSALLKEIGNAELGSCLRTADSVYFGGGTPSLVPEQFIEAILNALTARFLIGWDAEISLEMNPSTAESGKLPFYRAAGINRVSIGVQSFDDEELVAMTRAHTAKEARRAVEMAVDSGFTNASIDLMLGIPGQTASSFARNLRIAASLPIQHLSVYMLELHSGTPLHDDVRFEKIMLPSEDFVAEQYGHLVRFLEPAGLAQYEISNFARDGFQSRHNLKYWTRQPYMGFGLGSHSFDGIRRWKNTRSLSGYLAGVESGSSARAEERIISEMEAEREQFFLGMRLRQGISEAVLDAFVQRNRLLQQRWQSFLDQGWVERMSGHYRFTTAGYLVSNTILSELM